MDFGRMSNEGDWLPLLAGMDAVVNCVGILREALSATVVRPSLVYGEDGACSVMFRMLATLPALLLPMANEARVQAIHVDDLAALLLKLATAEGEVPRELAAVGPRATTPSGRGPKRW